MAYANVGGFNPVAGLYSGIVTTIVGSALARTVLMITTLTSALALSSRSVLTDAGLNQTDPANVAALAIVVGLVMLVFGVLKFGSIMNFVSNAHVAIGIGAVTSLVLYCVKASAATKLICLTKSADGDWYITPVPSTFADDAVIVLAYTGVGLFAEVPRIDEEWPSTIDSHGAVVVLTMRTLPDVPSSKVIKALRRWAEDLRANGGKLIIAGISPETAKVLRADSWRCWAQTA